MYAALNSLFLNSIVGHDALINGLSLATHARAIMYNAVVGWKFPVNVRQKNVKWKTRVKRSEISNIQTLRNFKGKIRESLG